jgi:flagellar biogenesis protein FliO
MENPIARMPLGREKAGNPWAAIYLASSLGLLLGAFNVSLAESINTAYAIQEIAAQTEAVESLSPASLEKTSRKIPDSVDIPGTQSAVLTVGRELHTTAPIINHELKGDPAQKATTRPSAESHITAPKTAPKYYLELPEPKAALKPSSIGQNDPIPTTATSVPIAPVSPQLEAPVNEQPQPALNPLLLPDPESQPLPLNDDLSPVASTASHALIRVTLGLMVVLGLLLVFAKSVLPRLMARHPEFFERLKQKNQSPKEAELVIPAPLDIPQSILANRQAKKEPPRGRWFASRKQQKTEQGHGSGTGQIQISEKQFNILSSTPLGKDKDLHLVEIMGRQLIVATTPYTVSLIQDLSGTEQPGHSAASNTATTGDPEKMDGHSLHLLPHDFIKPLWVETTRENRTLTEDKIPEMPETMNPHLENPETEQTPCQNLSPLAEEFVMAEDLDDQPPPASQAEFIRAKSNPYNSVPKFSELRYLEIESLGLDLTPEELLFDMENTDALMPEPQIQAEPDGVKAPAVESDLSEHGETAEATSRKLDPSLEGIVMLADYDDVYGY